MKKIYICSPLRGDIEGNIAAASGYCRQVAAYGYLPIAPHIYFTRFLDDKFPTEREAGMRCGLELLRMCDEVWVFGVTQPSEGMRAEIEEAKIQGKWLRDGFKALDLIKRIHRQLGSTWPIYQETDLVMSMHLFAGWLVVTRQSGVVSRYNAVDLAEFWLTHNNDEFFSRLGFNWVPPHHHQMMARDRMELKQTWATPAAPQFFNCIESATGRKSHLGLAAEPLQSPAQMAADITAACQAHMPTVEDLTKDIERQLGGLAQPGA